MAAEKYLDVLLRNMKPVLHDQRYVFCTVSEKTEEILKLNPLLMFRESEGVTFIIDEKSADSKSISYRDIWRMITLTVHSDLTGVGFIAAVTRKLADSDICVNVVAGYHHDHLFVQEGNAVRALTILQDFSTQF